MRRGDSWLRVLVSGEGAVYLLVAALVLLLLLRVVLGKEPDDAEAVHAAGAVPESALSGPAARRRQRQRQLEVPEPGAGLRKTGVGETNVKWTRQTHVVPCGAATLRVTQLTPSCASAGHLVTLHDAGLSHRACFNQLFQLALEAESTLSLFTVWHVDAPGAGDDSERLGADTPVNMEALAGHLHAALHTLGVGAFVGLGAGMGADVLLRFACEHPEAVLGLVLVRPAREPPTGTSAEGILLGALAKALRSGWTDRAGDLLAGHVFSGRAPAALREGLREELREASLRNAARLVAAFAERDAVSPQRLARARRVPALLVVGGRSAGAYVFSGTDPEPAAVELQRHLDRRVASILRVEGGPMPTIERPGELVQPLGLFLNGIGFG